MGDEIKVEEGTRVGQAVSTPSLRDNFSGNKILIRAADESGSDIVI